MRIIASFAQTARFAGSGRAVLLSTTTTAAQRVVGVNIDTTERKRAEDQQHALHAELDHRVKNVLATVSAIITQTPKADNSLADFVTGFGNRIRSLAETHELLSHNCGTAYRSKKSSGASLSPMQQAMLRSVGHE